MYPKALSASRVSFGSRAAALLVCPATALHQVLRIPQPARDDGAIRENAGSLGRRFGKIEQSPPPPTSGDEVEALGMSRPSIRPPLPRLRVIQVRLCETKSISRA
jgi:hypothetical protein